MIQLHGNSKKICMQYGKDTSTTYVHAFINVLYLKHELLTKAVKLFYRNINTIQQNNFTSYINQQLFFTQSYFFFLTKGSKLNYVSTNQIELQVCNVSQVFGTHASIIQVQVSMSLHTSHKLLNYHAIHSHMPCKNIYVTIRSKKQTVGTTCKLPIIKRIFLIIKSSRISLELDGI